MKKILLVFDGPNFSEGAFEFVRRLNEKQPLLVTGIFVPQTDYSTLWSYASAVGAGTGTAFVPILQEEETEAMTNNIHHFETLCQNNGMQYRVHKDFYDFILPELKKETRFADLVILSGELFYKGVIEANSFEYLSEALHAAECPVLIVPEHYDFPDNTILAYDGSAASVYAIKQFAYVFPEFANNATLLVYADEEKEKNFPSKDYITELASQHFPDLTFFKLDIDPRKYFITWITERKGSLLVCGSFSRSSFSQAFKKSFAADIIKDHKLPVFIAHK